MYVFVVDQCIVMNEFHVCAAGYVSRCVIMSAMPKKEIHRGLVFVAKVLQNLANDVSVCRIYVHVYR